MDRLSFASHKPTENHRLLPEPCILEHLPAARRPSQRFSDVLQKCVLCKTTSARAGDIKPESARQYWESRGGGGEAAVSSGISMPWASFLRVTEPDRLSQKCLALKRLFVPADSSQRRTRSEQACLVVGVCERRQRVCVWWGGRLYLIVSAGVKRDIVDSPLFLCVFVCLFTCVDWAWLQVLTLSKCLCAQRRVCDMCLFVFFGVRLQSCRCRGQTWGAARDGMREARGAAMCSTEAEKCLWQGCSCIIVWRRHNTMLLLSALEQLDIIWWWHRLCTRAGQTTTKVQWHGLAL